ncbi:MAG: cupin domain-containing protein [Peptococcaceae bacterium]|jgi:mannose-6-phosphate isomerase-like protein (cupin superfamily)|nr:cupin domain-containing protein [Peptococcaceae bacterium]
MEVIRRKEAKKTERKVWFDKLFTVGPSRETQIMRVVVEPGARSPLEGVGNHQAEYDYVVRGTTVMDIGGERVSLSAGDIVYIPSGVDHVGYNETGEDVEILTVVIEDRETGAR